MCGICGMFLTRFDDKLEKRISAMNASIAHRGPDASGIVTIKNGFAAIGHRRLSIIDLNENAKQPMTSANGKWTIAYNGEIYNFQDMKTETDYPYKTKSDTEVLLAYLDQFGIDALLRKCNGMFAFAAYDKVNDALYLCRDRLGIKPLYYYHDDNKLIFGSEIKAILHSGLVDAIPDIDSFDDYLGYRYVREPYTMFKNIRQVRSGTYVRISENRLTETTYWDIPKEFNTDSNFNEEEVCTEFEQRLTQAVLKRTISDVPLGTYLSGGIDSSLLSAITALNTSSRLNTYTIGFPELNEFKYSDMVAQKYGTAHHKLIINSEEYMSKLSEIIAFKDAPLGVPNEIPLALMSKELKKKITVVLSGEGADELLGGYGRIFRSPFDFVNTAQKGSFYDYFISKYEYVPRQIRDVILQTKHDRRNEYDEHIRNSFTNCPNEYNVFYFFHKYHVKGLLQRADICTMLASVEARVPFLDHELVEYSYRSIPLSLKLRWKNNSTLPHKNQTSADYSEILDTPKYILRKVAYKYLPKEVIDRKKVGFPVPLGQWNGILTEELAAHDNGLFCCDLDEIIRLCRQYPIGDQIIWMLTNLEIFFEIYFNRNWRW